MTSRRQRLDPARVDERIANREWQREADALVRTFKFGNFREALAFVNAVGELAEERDHHPDIDIRWNRVRLVLSTHSAGGITEMDLELTDAIDSLRQESAPGEGANAPA